MSANSSPYPQGNKKNNYSEKGRGEGHQGKIRDTSRPPEKKK